MYLFEWRDKRANANYERLMIVKMGDGLKVK